MRTTKVILLAFSILVLSACSRSTDIVGDIDRPAQGSDTYGRGYIFGGKIQMSPHGIDLIISNEMYKNIGKYSVMCAGSYNGKADKKTFFIPLVCSFGITGTAAVAFDKYNQISGYGSFRLSDGSTGHIWFGKAIVANPATN